MAEIRTVDNLCVIIDDEDLERVSRFRWYSNYHSSIDNYYIGTPIKENGRRKTMLLHRFLVNAPKGKCVDHANHNTLDNRKANLRICSQRENNGNLRKTKGNLTSKFKGVSWNKQKRKWLVIIQFNRKKLYLGYFTDEVEAAKAYDTKAKELFGEFALLNLPS